MRSSGGARKESLGNDHCRGRGGDNGLEIDVAGELKCTGLVRGAADGTE